MAAKIMPLSARMRKEQGLDRRSNSVLPVDAHESLNYSTLSNKFPKQNLLDVNLQMVKNQFTTPGRLKESNLSPFPIKGRKSIVNISPSRKAEIAENIPDTTLPKLPAKFNINLVDSLKRNKSKKGDFTP